LTITEAEELDRLRRYASHIIHNPYERAFFNLQKLIDNTPPSSPFHVLGTAIMEMNRKGLKESAT
jgi:hypothetical protein